MTGSAEVSTAAGKGPPEIEALRLLALESAGAARGERRRLIAAAAPVLSVLFRRFLVHDVQAPQWPDRDRFIISPSMQPLACALLHLLGRETEAAPGDAAAAATETPETTGPCCDLAPRGLDLPLDLPGHGLAAAVGMALATRLLRERFGEDLFHHATCVLVDDRDLEPGIAQETIAIAPWLRPHRLCVLHMTAVKADGSAHGRQRCPNHLARFAAAGWHVQQVRADDAEGLVTALEQAAEQGVASWEERRPAYIAIEYEAAAEVPSTTFLRQELGWEDVAAGDVPGEVRDEWRLVGLRGRKARRAWEQRLAEMEAAERTAVQRQLEMPAPEEFRQRMRALRAALAAQGRARDLQAMLPALLGQAGALLPELVVVTALHGELEGGEELPAAEDEQVQERMPPVLDLGLRPMAVAALLAGMAAHGGVRPLGVVRRHQLATMLPMLDEASRAGLSATLMVLEEEQCRRAPVELQGGAVACLCPADAVELVECWQTCIQQPQGVSVLFVPAGRMAAVRTSPEKTNLSALGGYELYSSGEEVQATLQAAGWTLAAALAAARLLEGEGVSVRVISVPAPQRLVAQDAEHRQRILGTAGVRLFVPPGEVAHAWSLLQCDGSVLSPCAQGAALPEVDVLAQRICLAVRAGLGQMPVADEDGTQEAER